MKRIEAADLARMGAPAFVIDFYSDTDPMHISLDEGVYTVSGVFALTANSAEELIAELSDLAAICLNLHWYAVQRDEDDLDWGKGSYDYDEAVAMAKKSGYKIITTVEMGEDPVAVSTEYVG